MKPTLAEVKKEQVRRERLGYPTRLDWAWNLAKMYRGRETYLGQYRREYIKREMDHRLRCNPKGKGNAAKRRIIALYNDPSCLVWPDYLGGGAMNNLKPLREDLLVGGWVTALSIIKRLAKDAPEAEWFMLMHVHSKIHHVSLHYRGCCHYSA